MKILNMKIYDPHENELRNINFNSSGASIIFGKITQPSEKKKTTNSIGKTLLLRFVGYIFGKKEKKTDYSEKIRGYHIQAIVSFQGNEYIVDRTLGDNKSIKINGQNYTYNKYLNFFNIDVRQTSKQIMLKRR